MDTQALSNDQKERIAWWQEARFGMFIHWGLYSVGGLDCWKMHDMGIPIDEYIARFEPRFTARGFDARAIARAALSGGCKYVVMGSRHHEGYCLWNTRTTRFSSVHMTPKRDLIGEYVQAVREAGLRIGFYYSLLDWRYKAYWDGPRKDPKAWAKLVDYVHAQVKELLTNYGKIDILWYDGAWSENWGFTVHDQETVEAWRSAELYSAIRQLQPGILINNRSGLPGDFGTPEGVIVPESRPWELCDTMGSLWGYAPQDLNRKPVHEIIRRLIICVSAGGNMLLNVGPKPDGGLQGWQVRMLSRIGDWLKVHGEAIYGCTAERASPFTPGLCPWVTTRKGDVLYVHLLRYPGASFSVANYHDYWLESAELLDTGEDLRLTHEPTRDVLSGLPKTPPDRIATVVKIKTRQKTEAERKATRLIALDGPDSLLSTVGH